MAVTDDFLARSREAQRIAPAPLAGVSASKRDAHPRWRVSRQANVGSTLVRSVSTHPTLATRCFLRAKWSLLARLRAGVFTCKVFLRCRDTRSAWRDDFVSWLGVRCRAVTRPGLARHFLHHPAAPLPLQSRWFIRACCSSGDSLQHAQVQGVSLLCSDAHLAWCDDFRRLAGVRCRVVTRLDLARHFFARACSALAATAQVGHPNIPKC